MNGLSLHLRLLIPLRITMGKLVISLPGARAVEQKFTV